ncbi:aldolase [Methanofollis formosanus]|uniref:Aldolase n=1 Tax=Methanofollis formosanus TaxID=299308 RepID=A0A8G1EFV3_9EURY|nr:aldolase [Methanofollis formosanus]QYZ78257.1 aldolase [Methanofollis formosanus]
MPDQEFVRIGKRLFSEGLVGGNFGNISLRTAEGFYITRTGAYLDVPGAPVLVPFDGPAPAGASSEYRVHQAIYRRIEHRAIVHAHPAHAVAASVVLSTIVPVDSEGEMLCPEIPVVGGAPGTEELAENVAEALEKRPLVIARGHGTFAAAADLDRAYLLTSLAEHSCRVLAYSGFFGGCNR